LVSFFSSPGALLELNKYHELTILIQCEEKDIIESLNVLQTKRLIQEKNGKYYQKKNQS